MKRKPSHRCEEVRFFVRWNKDPSDGVEFLEYQGARSYLEKCRMEAESLGERCDLILVTKFDEAKHLELIGELIKDFRESKTGIKEPMVVFLPYSKEYQILSNAELTPDRWLEEHYATLGTLEMWERMVMRRRLDGIIEKSSFLANEFDDKGD